MRGVLVALFVLSAELSGCVWGEPCTDPTVSRCKGEEVQFCSEEGYWQTVQECGKVEPGRWVCLEVDKTPGCFPESEKK